MPDASSQASSARTAHTASWAVHRTPSSALLASWSPLERRTRTTSPSGVRVTSSTRSATSSDRRNAPIHARVRSARSRRPTRSSPRPRTSASMSASRSGAFCDGAVPSFRRIPAITSAIAGALFGHAKPCARCVYAMPASVEGRLPLPGERRQVHRHRHCRGRRREPRKPLHLAPRLEGPEVRQVRLPRRARAGLHNTGPPLSPSDIRWASTVTAATASSARTVGTTTARARAVARASPLPANQARGV